MHPPSPKPALRQGSLSPEQKAALNRFKKALAESKARLAAIQRGK
jgi:hypothetical protein